MRSVLSSGIVAGLSLVFALSATAQTPSAPASQSLALPTQPHDRPEDKRYDYDFIDKGYVWSNKPLPVTAGKICKTMKDRAFSETAYSISGEQDWNSCLSTQIRSIGYLRWLRNAGFKPSRKNRKSAQKYLKETYTMGPWGSYTFNQLLQAAESTGSGPLHP